MIKNIKKINPRNLWKKMIKHAEKDHKKKNMGVGYHSIPKPKKY
tara:strand:- start:467 stop:598 length:132 start_codon:yes stop_codon:yes gene_type:complete